MYLLHPSLLSSCSTLLPNKHLQPIFSESSLQVTMTITLLTVSWARNLGEERDVWQVGEGGQYVGPVRACCQVVLRNDHHE